MVKDNEMMIVMPYEKGGYAVRPIDWAGIWDKDWRLESSCRFTALFPDKAEAEEYCRICNDTLRTAILYLRNRLLHDESLRKGFISSISSALKENNMPFLPEKELAERVLNFIVGDKPAKSMSFECSFEISEESGKALYALFASQLENVDVTGYSDDTILWIMASCRDAKRFVTTDYAHYESLQSSRGFRCYDGEEDTLFGIPLILDQKGEIEAAKIEILKGGTQDYDD